MGTAETIFIIIIILIGVGIRFLRYYLLHIKKSDFTSCPNCNKTKSRIKAGKYECDSCGFRFEVNEQGDSIKNSLWSIIIVFGLGIYLVIKLLHYFFKEEPKTSRLLKELNPPSDFDKVLLPIIIVILIILTVVLFYTGIRGIQKYLKDRKQRTTRSYTQ